MGITKSAALEGAEHGVRVNAVLPRTIDTGMSRGLVSVRPDVWDGLVENIPLGRAGQPDEVAEAAAWLCSGRSSFVTGHGLVVDGGRSAG